MHCDYIPWQADLVPLRNFAIMPSHLFAAATFLCLALSVSTGASVPFEVVFGLPHSHPKALEQAFWEISTPGSDKYLKHLSVREVEKLVGASTDDIEKTTAWLLTTFQPDRIQISPLNDSVTATFSAQKGSLWTKHGLPRKHTHPLPFDFVLRRDPRVSVPGGEFGAPSKKRQVPSLTGAYSIEAQKRAYGIPVSLESSNETTLQMVWGPGTFGYDPSQLAQLKESECPLLNLSKVKFDTPNHGTPGGDNWMEGNLDVSMISTFGLNVETLVSNTNTSASTEEGNGFGQAMLDFVTELAGRDIVPQVLSISLGSLSAHSCDALVDGCVKAGHEKVDCAAYLQHQRQVCMFLSEDQLKRINAAFQILGVRGVSVFGSSGDGGSHFSFQPFGELNPIGAAMNKVSCQLNLPVFPTTSPYVTSVGGTDWQGWPTPDSSRPEAWSGSGGGFSWEFKRPAHQEEAVSAYLTAQNGSASFPPPGSFNQNGRAYPDISAVSVEGTSQSSPTIAGIFSMVTDHRLNKGLPPLGFLGPRLYKMNMKYPGDAFEDITKGNTKTSCPTGFPAVKGWDPVTGFGRPVWAGLLKHFGDDAEV